MYGAKLTQFTLGGELLPVRFIETQTIKDGVECDVYAFAEDTSRDLAIVRVAKGSKTSLQRVVLGEKTAEGFVSGAGTLTVRGTDGQIMTHEFNAATEQSGEVIVAVGQTMQWHAAEDADLTFYEICEPPYADGRFEDLKDD